MLDDGVTTVRGTMVRRLDLDSFEA